MTGVVGVKMQRDETTTLPRDSERCRVPQCGGPLRFEVNRYGVVVDICERCEARVRHVGSLMALVQHHDAELRAARREIASLRARTPDLRQGIHGSGTAGRIMVALRSSAEPMGVRDIAARLADTPYTAVAQMLSSLSRRGHIRRVGRGLYEAVG